MVDARHKRNGICLLPITLSFLDLPDDTPDTAEVRIASHGLSADKLLRRLMRRCGVTGGTLLQHGICDSPRLSEALVRMVLDWAMRGFPEAKRVRMAEVHAILCAWVCRDTGGGKVSMRQETAASMREIGLSVASQMGEMLGQTVLQEGVAMG